MTSLAALPAFLAHFLAGLALVAAGVFVYTRVTPHDEVRLIRAGNAAAAVKLGGAVLGLALPVASAVANSGNLLDATVWGAVAVAAQVVVFAGVTRVLLPDWRAAMEERREVAGATLQAVVLVAVGMINAACLTT